MSEDDLKEVEAIINTSYGSSVLKDAARRLLQAHRTLIAAWDEYSKEKEDD